MPPEWRGRLKGTCLLANYQNQVFGVACVPSSMTQNWVLVP